jgi:sec-independent protein translocase protein TatB
MFDVGFTELMVIALVALIVLGPERLPRVARTAGHLLGRLQRYVGDVKADINREIQLEDLKKLQHEVAEQARTMEESLNKHMKSVETSLNDSIAQGIGEKQATGPSPVTPSDGVSPPLTLADSEKPKT